MAGSTKSMPSIAEVSAAMTTLGRALSADVEAATRAFGKMLHPNNDDRRLSP